MKSDRAFWLLFVSLGALNAAAIAWSPLSLSADETHYWDWSRRLDWSYYSKGPLVAVLIYAGRSIFGDTALGVRFPALVCYSLFSAVFYFFVRRFYTPQLALLGFVILRSMLVFVQMGILMTTDAPAALFWLAALVCAYLAVVEERRGYWIFYGLAVGLGMSAKYTSLFLFASTALFLLLTPPARNHLRSPQFWAGAGAMLLGFAPILIWNAEHDWVNFAHNAGHVVKSGPGFSLSLRYLPELVLGQAGLAGPILFVILVLAMKRGFALWRANDLAAGIFLFSCLPLGIFVLAVSLAKRVYANWPMPVYIGALLLLIHLLSLRVFGNGRTARWLRAGIVLSAVMSVAAHIPLFGVTFGLPGKILPTKKLAGWKELGAAVSGKGGTVIADDYEVASAAAFYARPHPEAYCAYLDDRRMNQYDVWGGWEKLKGRDAIFVTKEKANAEKIRPHFEALEERPGLIIEYGNEKLREFFIYQGKNYDGFVPELPARR